MGTQQNGSLGLTKKSILERLDTLIELNKKIYDAKIARVEAIIPDVNTITSIAKTEAEKVKTDLSVNIPLIVEGEVTKQLAKNAVVAQPQIDKLKLDNKLL